jgi:hypothetical protein
MALKIDILGRSARFLFVSFRTIKHILIYSTLLPAITGITFIRQCDIEWMGRARATHTTWQMFTHTVGVLW